VCRLAPGSVSTESGRTWRPDQVAKAGVDVGFEASSGRGERESIEMKLERVWPHEWQHPGPKQRFPFPFPFPRREAWEENSPGE